MSEIGKYRSQLAITCSKLAMKTLEQSEIFSKLTIKTPTLLASFWCLYC